MKMPEINLGKPIARGRTADVYTWQEGQVLKLFHDWFTLENVQYEQRIGSAIHAAGLPVPAAGDILQINGSNGLVYERVHGLPMWEILSKKPWRLFSLAYLTATLHAEMHSVKIQADLPSQTQQLEYKIQQANALPSLLQEAVLKSLVELPPGDSLCHGDFHPLNILVSASGPVIIDWIDASFGNPLADLARSTILILGAASSAQIPRSVDRFIVRRFHSTYLRHYFQLRPGGEKEYRLWLPVVAAARLSENIQEVEEWLLKQVEKILN
jgi:aminoglycoside phosphotransferase (APT) family kinase protein